MSNKFLKHAYIHSIVDKNSSSFHFCSLQKSFPIELFYLTNNASPLLAHPPPLLLLCPPAPPHSFPNPKKAHKKKQSCILILRVKSELKAPTSKTAISRNCINIHPTLISPHEILMAQLTLYLTSSCTGCSLNIVFFSKILKYIPDSGRSLFSSVVYTDDIMAGRTPALQQNWQSSEKFQNVSKKHNN